MPTTLYIIVMKAAHVQARYALRACSVMIGRSESCSVVLDHPGVSRTHAEISLEQGAYYLNDLGSANGTQLNGARQTRGQLHSGDVITIGDFTLQLTIAADPEPKVNSASGSTDRTVRLPAGPSRD